MGYVVPTVSSGPDLGSPASLMCPAHLQRKLAAFDANEQQLYSEFPPDVQASHSVYHSKASHPMEQLISATCTHEHCPPTQLCFPHNDECT